MSESRAAPAVELPQIGPAERGELGRYALGTMK